MPKHVFENSCPFSSIFIYIASVTTLCQQILIELPVIQLHLKKNEKKMKMKNYQ